METRKITFENATIEDLLLGASLVNWYAEEIANLPNTHISTLLKNAFFREVVLKTSVKALENEVALITSTIDNLGVDEDNVRYFYATMINRLLKWCDGTYFPDFFNKKELEKIVDWEIEAICSNKALSEEEIKDEIQTLAYEIFRHHYFVDDIELGYAFAKRGTDPEKVKEYTLKAYDINVSKKYERRITRKKFEPSTPKGMYETQTLLNEAKQVKSKIAECAKDYHNNEQLINELLDRMVDISDKLDKLSNRISLEDLILDTSDCIKDEDVKQGRTTLYTHDQMKTYIIEAIFEDGVDDYVDLYDYVNEIGMPDDAIKMLRSILLLDESCMDRKIAEGLAECWVDTYYRFA